MGRHGRTTNHGSAPVLGEDHGAVMGSDGGPHVDARDAPRDRNPVRRGAPQRLATETVALDGSFQHLVDEPKARGSLADHDRSPKVISSVHSGISSIVTPGTVLGVTVALRWPSTGSVVAR